MDELALGLAGFGIATGLAVGAGLLAAVVPGGERGWGLGRAARLERLGRPAWAELGSSREGRPKGRGGSGDKTRAAGALTAGRLAFPSVAGWLAAAAVGALAGGVALGGPGGALAGAVGAAWAWQTRRVAAGVAARRRFQDGLEAALETMVASLRAGRGLVRALEDAAAGASEPLRGALGGLVAAHRAGQPLAAALADLAEDYPLAEVGYVSACLRTHLRTGGDVTALLVNVGGLLRERRQLGRELAARTAEARSTAVLLALLPPAILAYVLWVQPSQLTPLLVSPFGRAALALAAGCWGAGVAVIRRMLAGLGREIEEGE